MRTALDFMIAFGLDEDQAQLAAAIERGEIEGDTPIVDETDKDGDE